MTDFSRAYGSWAVITGGSDGIGAAFAHSLAARGLNLVLVARRTAVLEECAAAVTAAHAVLVRTISLDLATETAIAELYEATADLEVGVLICNAGADTRSAEFLDRTLDDHRALVHRNCVSVLEAVHRFGGPMVARGRGAVVLVTSGAAWAGGRTLSSYGATKAFDLVLGEGLWAEWRDSGVHVLSLVLGATDTPSLHRTIDPGNHVLADPHDVAEQALDHLAEGPTYIHGSDNPAGGSPFGSLDRRSAVLAMSARR